MNGHAIAGGCVLAAACDVRLMSGGTIGLTELLVGVPFPTAVLEIVRYAVGPATGALALTGRTLSPAEAARIGLVHAVVPPVDLLDQALGRARELGRLPATAYALTKAQLHGPARERIAERAPVDDPRLAELWQSEAGLAAVTAYLDGLGRRRGPQS